MFILVVKQHILVQLEPTQLPFRSIRALFVQGSVERLLLARFRRQIQQLTFVYPNTLLHRSERFERADQTQGDPPVSSIPRRNWRETPDDTTKRQTRDATATLVAARVPRRNLPRCTDAVAHERRQRTKNANFA